VSEGRAEPVWFGPSEAPLFGLLNMPEGPVRAAVVLCPPLGREYTNSYSTFAELAARLALNGLAVLRFDYRSTGDSFDRVGASEDGPGFVRDVSLAVELVRSLGASRLALVGMRIGGNFARQYCTSEPVDALVLWDPCPNGRTFLREQRLLALLASVDGASPDALDLPGLELTAEMAEEIGAVDRTTDSRGSGGNLAGDVGALREKRVQLVDECLAAAEQRDVAGRIVLRGPGALPRVGFGEIAPPLGGPG